MHGYLTAVKPYPVAHQRSAVGGSAVVVQFIIALAFAAGHGLSAVRPRQHDACAGAAARNDAVGALAVVSARAVKHRAAHDDTVCRAHIANSVILPVGGDWYLFFVRPVVR